MVPELRITEQKILVGKSLTMSFSENKTFELWKSFMPHRKEIINRVSDDLFSIQVYPRGFFDGLDPEAKFGKWAAIEVDKTEGIPDGMEIFNMPGGLYAVFNYVGRQSEAEAVFRYILGIWLPSSGYILDDRPHFEILGEKYRNDDPSSEEEIWIPVRPGKRPEK